MTDVKVEVHPDSWVLPNRKGFSQWVYETFHTDHYPMNKHGATMGSIRLFPHQRIIRDYMQFDSPYRGILLYHGLGVGKTCASIAAAEGFIAQHKKVIVMLPASLAPNYKQEILRCASIGNPSGKTWNLVDVSKGVLVDDMVVSHSFAKSNKFIIWLPSVPKGAHIVRKNVSWASMSEQEHDMAIGSLMDIVDHKYTFINYNGLNTEALNKLPNNFFDHSLVIMDEAHNFISRVVNGGKIATNLYKRMMMTQTLRMVLLSGTPVINHPFEISSLLNLVRGPMTVHSVGFLKAATTMPTEEEILEKLGELQKYIDHIAVITDQKQVEWTMVPTNFVLTEDKRVVRQEWKETEAKIMEQIRNILQKEFKTKKVVATTLAYPLPNHKDEFESMFLDQTDPENPRVKNMDLFMRRIAGMVSYFRSAGEEYFPKITVRKVEQVPFSDYQFQMYDKVRDEERKMETNQKKMNRLAPAGVFGAKGTVYRAFSRMACNFAFPEQIKRKFPKDLRKEFVKMLEKEVDILEDDRVEEKIVIKKKDDKADGKDGKEDSKKLVAAYEEDLKRVMDALHKDAPNVLTADALSKSYSPKLAKALEHIQTCPGKSLLYSQFRSIEGLGVMKLVLLQAGWAELRLEKKKDGSWYIFDHEKVLSPEYDRKRFIIFDNNRDKIKVLLQIYNGEFNQLPSELQKQIGKRTNLYGELASLLMITQSGAEGISLKNVRRVMILEPFWNMVRMEQVIGRAVRTASHEELPPTERTVEVYIYESVFTPKQLKQNFTLVRLDEGLTSDAHIMRIAETKDQLIQTFLNHMKAASMDCMVHATINRTVANGIKCYSFPIPVGTMEESFIPDISRDITFPSRLVRHRNVQGKVVTFRNKKYVVVEEYPDKLFDYVAYKDAGVLLPAKML